MDETPWWTDLLIAVGCAIAAYTMLTRSPGLAAGAAWCSGACFILALTKWLESRRG